VETLVAVAILSMGLLSSFLVYLNAKDSSQLARDTITATTVGDYIFEEMVSRAALSDITDTDWQAWALNEGVAALPEQAVTVTYADEEADPLAVTLEVGWERKEREYHVTLTTELTK